MISSYSNIVEVKPSADYTSPFLVSNDEVLMFPNPVQKGNDLTVDALFDNPVRSIRLINFNGSIIQEINGKKNQNKYSIKTNDLNAGVYIVETILADNTKLIKKFLVE